MPGWPKWPKYARSLRTWASVKPKRVASWLELTVARPARTKCCNSRKYRLKRLTTTAGTSLGFAVVFCFEDTGGPLRLRDDALRSPHHTQKEPATEGQVAVCESSRSRGR